MATHVGKDGFLTAGATSVGELRGYTLNETSDVVEDTVIGDDWKTRKSTLRDWNCSGDLFWDEADAGQLKLTVGSVVTLALYPEGAASGDTYKQGSSIITSFNITGRHDSLVEANFTADGNGTLSVLTV